jgi:hypothetical protein
VETVKAPDPAPAHPRAATGWNRAGGRGPEARAASAISVAPREAARATNAEWKLNTSGIEEIARGPASERDERVFVRSIKANPYSLGLDLSLFDRVSLAYQKRSEGLRGLNDYVKRLPKREPKTVRDLLERNKEMEL